MKNVFSAILSERYDMPNLNNLSSSENNFGGVGTSIWSVHTSFLGRHPQSIPPPATARVQLKRGKNTFCVALHTRP